MSTQHFQSLVPLEKKMRKNRGRSFAYVPETIKKALKIAIPKTTTEEEAYLKFLEVCPPEYRIQFQLEVCWIGSRVVNSIKYVPKRPKPDHIYRSAKLKFIKGEEWENWAVSRGIERKRIRAECAKWKAEIAGIERSEREANKEAEDRVIQMKMMEMTSLIEKMLDAIERAVKGINESETFDVSPRELKDLVAACCDLQKMRNLEEGRPTSIGAGQLTRKGIVERLKRLQAANVPLEIDPSLLDDLGSDKLQ